MRVLVVDDHVAMYALLEVVLTGTVDWAADAVAALQALAVETYDLVILEGKLPEMSGSQLWEAVAERCREERRSAPRVIGMTGHQKMVAEFERLGIPCLPKPFDLKELDRMIQEVLGKARS